MPIEQEDFTPGYVQEDEIRQYRAGGKDGTDRPRSAHKASVTRDAGVRASQRTVYRDDH
jgi:hypothetical protein